MREGGLLEIWRLDRIGDLCLPVSNIDFKQRSSPSFRYIDISSVDNESKRIASTVQIASIDAPSRAKHVIASDDVIVSTVRPGLNAVALVTQELNGEICSTGFCVLRANKSVLQPEFLFFWVRHPAFIQNLARQERGIGYPAVSNNDVESFIIPLPPLFEQQRIVTILRQADELRKLRREANKTTDQLLPALFQEMFGHPLHWKETIPLESLVDFVGGGTPSRKIEKYFTGSIPWATSKDIKSRYLADAQEHITEEAIEKSATNLVLHQDKTDG